MQWRPSRRELAFRPPKPGNGHPGRSLYGRAGTHAETGWRTAAPWTMESDSGSHLDYEQRGLGAEQIEVNSAYRKRQGPAHPLQFDLDAPNIVAAEYRQRGFLPRQADTEFSAQTDESRQTE